MKWVEVVGADLIAAWESTFQGFECAPPTRMWHAPIHELFEIWIHEEGPDCLISYSRWRPNRSSWWFARRGGPLSDMRSIERIAVRLLESELSRMKRRLFETGSIPDGFDPVLGEVVEFDTSR